MGETLLGKPYGLTHEDMIKAHHLFTATAKETPYQLDLEVKGRKPDIVPKVGDKVKIKSREWYEKWKRPAGNVQVLYSFVEDMAKHCGRVFTVKEVRFVSQDWRFKLEEDEKEKTWSLEMFEEVYPQESSKVVECAKAFESLSVNASALEELVMATPVFPAIGSVQGIGIATDWGKIISDTSAVTASSRCVEVDILDLENRLKKLCSKQPELQTIKKHRFIKLENL